MTTTQAAMNSSQQREQFVQLIIRSQSRLSAYIMSLVADRDLTDDILQETNLKLLRQEDQFTPGTDFLAWAINVAYFQVLTSRKQLRRERLRFDDELVDLLAHDSAQRSTLLDERLTALRRCLDSLDADQRAMVQARYEGKSVQQLAADSLRPPGIVSQVLYRARKVLAECVRRKLQLKGEGSS